MSDTRTFIYLRLVCVGFFRAPSVLVGRILSVILTEASGDPREAVGAALSPGTINTSSSSSEHAVCAISSSGSSTNSSTFAPSQPDTTSATITTSHPSNLPHSHLDARRHRPRPGGLPGTGRSRSSRRSARRSCHGSSRGTSCVNLRHDLGSSSSRCAHLLGQGVSRRDELGLGVPAR